MGNGQIIHWTAGLKYLHVFIQQAQVCLCGTMSSKLRHESANQRIGSPRAVSIWGYFSSIPRCCRCSVQQAKMCSFLKISFLPHFLLLALFYFLGEVLRSQTTWCLLLCWQHVWIIICVTYHSGFNSYPRFATSQKIQLHTRNWRREARGYINQKVRCTCGTKNHQNDEQ